MEAILNKEFFYEERFKVASDYIGKIVELKKQNTPNALNKIMSIKRLIRAMYNVR
ncbi:MAG: hypothetical protein KAX05_09135 [Bacteroidales bacterium]|nr:hypothetical protein [Bacteroidales bacterium]